MAFFAEPFLVALLFIGFFAAFFSGFLAAFFAFFIGFTFFFAGAFAFFAAGFAFGFEDFMGAGTGGRTPPIVMSDAGAAAGAGLAAGVGIIGSAGLLAGGVGSELPKMEENPPLSWNSIGIGIGEVK